MEPYYTMAEQLYQVHGARGEDPTEPPASAPYPFPAVSHEPRIQQLHDDLAAAGHQPFHAPCGVMLAEADMPNSACVRCATCDGFPCLVHAKSDAEVLGVRPALEHPNVTLVTHAEAVGLETNAAGTTVTGVVVDHDGTTETLHRRPRRRLVRRREQRQAAAGVGERRAPERPGQRLRPWSGATTCSTTAQAVLALSKEPNPTVFQKTLGLNDFYFGGGDVDYPLGNIQMVGKSSAEMYRGEKPLQTKLAPEWTLRDVARHAVDFWLSTEDLPRAGEPRDAAARRPRSRSRTRPTNDEPKQQLLHELKRLLGPLGMHHDHLHPRHAYLKNDIPVAGVRAPGRHLPLRPRPRDLGAEHRLPRARGRQPLRRRHELLPEHRRGEPGADRDGQRAARRRPPARAARRAPRRPEAAHA